MNFTDESTLVLREIDKASVSLPHDKAFYNACGFNAYRWNAEFPWLAKLKPQHGTWWAAGYQAAKTLGIRQFPKVNSAKLKEDKAHGARVAPSDFYSMITAKPHFCFY
jgi:hypothetical protein